MSTKAQWDEAVATARQKYEEWMDARAASEANPRNQLLAMEANRAAKRFDEANQKAKAIRSAWLNPSNPEPEPAT